MSEQNFCWAFIDSVIIDVTFSTITMFVVDVVNVVAIALIYSINCSLWAFQCDQLRCSEAGDEDGDCTCLLFALNSRVF